MSGAETPYRNLFERPCTLLVADPRDERRLIADIGGLVFSDDGGRTLRPVATDKTAISTGFARSACFSRDGRSIFVGARAPKELLGVLSRDGGATWRAIPAKGLSRAGDLKNARAAMDPDGLLVAAPNLVNDHVIRVSRNDGASWETVGRLIEERPDRQEPVAAVRFAATSGRLLTLWGDFQHWWVSSDAGKTRTPFLPSPDGVQSCSSGCDLRVCDGLPLLDTGFGSKAVLDEDGRFASELRLITGRNHSSSGDGVAVDRLGRTWYLIKNSFLLRSHDGGRTWFRAPMLPPPNRSSGVLLLREREFVYATAHATLAIKDDRAGAHPLFTVPVPFSTEVRPAPDFPQTVIAARAEGPLRECHWFDPDPRDPRRILAWDGFSLLVSEDGGNQFAAWGTADLLSVQWPGTWRPVVASIQRDVQSDTLFIEARQGTGAGLLSRDGGRSFQAVPAPPGIPSGVETSTVLARGEFVMLLPQLNQLFRSSTYGQSWRGSTAGNDNGNSRLLRVNHAALLFEQSSSSAMTTLTVRDVITGKRQSARVPANTYAISILSSGSIVEDAGGLAAYSAGSTVLLDARQLTVVKRSSGKSLRGITRDPAKPSVFFALIGGALHRSDDGLATWVPATSAPTAATWSDTIVWRAMDGEGIIFYVAEDGRMARVRPSEAFPAAASP